MFSARCAADVARRVTSVKAVICSEPHESAKTLREADSQGTSTVLCGDDLKSELGGLPTEPVFGTPDHVGFRLVKNTFGVSLLCAQQVEHDASKFVGCGCNRLGPAELTGDSAEEFAQIVFGVMQ